MPTIVTLSFIVEHSNLSCEVLTLITNSYADTVIHGIHGFIYIMNMKYTI